MDLKGRDFLKLLDFTPEEIEYLLDLAADLKDPRSVKKKASPIPPEYWQVCSKVSNTVALDRIL